VGELRSGSCGGLSVQRVRRAAREWRSEAHAALTATRSRRCAVRHRCVGRTRPRPVGRLRRERETRVAARVLSRPPPHRTGATLRRESHVARAVPIPAITTNTVARSRRKNPQSPPTALTHQIGFVNINRMCATAHRRCRWLLLQITNETGSNSRHAKNRIVARRSFEAIVAPAPGPEHAKATLGQSSAAAPAAKNFVVE
jgi:hypothetical protein